MRALWIGTPRPMSSTNISNNSGSAPNVPEVVIQRLPLYVRALTQFAGSGDDVISSEQLGQRLQMTPAQIGKAHELASEWWEKHNN